MFEIIPNDILKAAGLLKKKYTQKKKYFTETNTGNLNENRLANGLSSCWNSKRPTENYEKQIVVITDWTYAHQDINESSISFFLSLLFQDFEIYLWIGQILKVCSGTDLAENISTIKPIHAQTIEGHMATIGIKKDDLKIIDYLENERIQGLISKNNLRIKSILTNSMPENILRLSHLSKFAAYADPKLIFKSLDQDRALTLLVKTATESTLQKDCMSLAPIKDLFLCIDNAEELIAFENSYPTNLRGLLLDLENSPSETDISVFFDKNPSLSTAIIICADELQIGSHEKLQTLLIGSTKKVSFGSLKNLEILTVSGSQKQRIVNQEHPIELPRLKMLSINDVATIDLLYFVNNANQDILFLGLQDVDIQDIDATIFEKFTALRYLEILNTSLSVSLAHRLLFNNPGLEQLTLDTESMSLELLFRLNFSKLPQLKTITLHIELGELHSINSLFDFDNALLAILSNIGHNINFSLSITVENKALLVIKYNNKSLLVDFKAAIEIPQTLAWLLFDAELQQLAIQDSINHQEKKGVVSIFLEKILDIHQLKLRNLLSFNNDFSCPLEVIELPLIKAFKFPGIQLSLGALVLSKTIPLDFFIEILMNPKFNCSEILLQNGAAFIGGPFPDHLNFPRIKKILIHGDSDISPQQSAFLINKSPNLTELHCGKAVNIAIPQKIKHLTIIEDNDLIIPSTLTLNYLHLSNSLNPQKWLPLLKRSKQLESFELRSQHGNILLATEATEIVQIILKNTALTIQQLKIDKYFEFQRHQYLKCNLILDDEQYFHKLLQFSPKMKTIEIKQTLALPNLIMDNPRNKLKSLELTSKVDEKYGSLASQVDTLLRAAPQLKKLSLTIYNRWAHFTILEDPSEPWPTTYELDTSEPLTGAQLTTFCLRFDFHTIQFKHLLSDHQIENPITIDRIQVADFPSLIKLFSAFNAKQWDSPYFKIINGKSLYIDGSQLNERDFPPGFFENLAFSELNLANNFRWKNISKTMIQAKKINLININIEQSKNLLSTLYSHSTRFVMHLLQSDRAHLFSIRRHLSHLVISGRCCPEQFLKALFLECIPTMAKVGIITFINFCFDPKLQLPRQALRASKISFSKTDINGRILENIIQALQCRIIQISDCSSITEQEVLYLKKQYSLDINYSAARTSTDSASVAKPANFPSLLSDEIDRNTGTQGTGAITEDNTHPFKPKPDGQPYPNYFRNKIRYVENKSDDDELITFTMAQTSEAVRKQYQEDDAEHYLCEIVFPLVKDDTLYALNSLSPNEQLLSIYASAPIEIYYSQKDNRYYISSQKDSVYDLKVTFLLKAKIRIEHADKQNDRRFDKYFHILKNYHAVHYKFQIEEIKNWPNNQKLALIIAYCAGFSIDDLSKSGHNLDAIIKERKGVCRHRVAACVELAKRLEVKDLRVILNDIHTFIEIFINDQWQMVCLGGSSQPSLENNSWTTPKKSPQKSPRLEALQEYCSEIIALETPSALVQEEKQENHPLQDLNPFNRSKTTRTLAVSSFEDLCEILFSLDLKQILLSFESASQIEQFYAVLVSRLSPDQGFNYIHKLNEFMPKELVLNTESKQLKTQPHPLLNQIMHAKKGDILLVNISNYDGDIVNDINALTDTQGRTLAQHRLADELKLIVLKLDATEIGEDLKTRFSQEAIYKVPYIAEQDLFRAFAVNEQPSPDIPALDLYDGQDWQGALLGRLKLQTDSISFKKGWLLQELERKSSCLALYNPPLQEEDFRLFLIELFYTKKIYYQGISFRLPEHFKLHMSLQSYNLSNEQWIYDLENYDEHKPYDLLLNSATYSALFKRYTCEDGRLIHKKGWLKKQGHLSILVTETMDESLWAKLIKTANQLNCQLSFTFAESAELPNSMLARAQNIHKEKISNSKNRIMVSNDIDFSEKILCEKLDKFRVFSLREDASFDLFESLNMQIKEEHIHISWQSGPLRDALLMENHTLILKGTFNEEIASRLQSLFLPKPYLLINGNKEYYSNPLILISEKSEFLSAIKLEEFQYSEQDYFDDLSNRYSIEPLKSKYDHLKSIFGALPYQSLAKMYHYGGMQIRQTCFGLHPKYLENKIIPLKISDFLENEKSITTYRSLLLNEHLERGNVVFILGSSGVGKSTFVRAYFPKDNLFIGLDNFKKWLIQGGNFFLDEANTYPKEILDMFLGLFNQTPGILYDKNYYPISEKHRIIFAGNYSNYAHRELHPLFQKIPIVEFEAFSSNYLKTIIIKSLDNSRMEYKDKTVSIFLDTYQQVSQDYPQAGWTLRNLENMILRFIVCRKKSIDPLSAAYLAAYDELENNLDKQAQSLQLAIEKQHPPLRNLIEQLNALYCIRKHDFILTRCRKNLFRLISDQIHIQLLKNDHPELSTMGAVCGFLLEGESGIGKSAIMIEALEAMGYKNAALYPVTEQSNLRYYFINQSDDRITDTHKSSSLSPLELRLTDAFHKGWPVVIDEFNTFNLEKIMNALLSGVDLEGKTAITPGFFAFLTENPISYIGRNVLASPLKNRLFFKKLEEYSNEGIEEIVLANAPGTIARPISFFFNLSRQVNTRDLFKHLDNLKKHPFAIFPENVLISIFLHLDPKDLKAVTISSLYLLMAYTDLFSPQLFKSSRAIYRAIEM